MYLPYELDNASVAKKLRKNMTKEERRLWYEFLRTYPIKFYRQKRIGQYIVDFHCNAAKLIVELDGGQHYTPGGKAYDEKRTHMLQSHRLHVMRFSNLDINQHFREVCVTIDRYVQEHINRPCR